MSKGHWCWCTAGLLLGLLVVTCSSVFATVDSVTVLALSNGSFVSPGDRVGIARIELTDDETGDIWRALTVTNAGENDDAVTGLQVFWDNGNHILDDGDQPITEIKSYVQGRVTFDIGRINGGGSFLFEGRSITGSAMAFVVAHVGSGTPDDLIDVSIGAGAFIFDKAGSTGPPAGYFGASGPYLSGVTDIAIMPLNNEQYVNFGERIEIVSIVLTANAGGDEWQSLTVSAASNAGKPEAVNSIQIFRDNPQQNDSEETFGTLDPGDVALGVPATFSTDRTARFTELQEPVLGLHHYLLVVTTATPPDARQGDLLDVDISMESFQFTNAGVTGTIYRGGQGPYIGNAPPTLALLEPDGQDDLADASYLIQYQAADPDNEDAQIALYASNQDFLAPRIQAALESLDSNGDPVVPMKSLNTQVGFEGVILVSSDISTRSQPQQFEWLTTLEGNNTVEVAEGDYYIYAAIQDIVVEKPGEPETQILRTVVVRSSGFVTVKHIPDISNLSPLQDTEEGSGTYLISWNDRKYGATDGSISLYYSTNPNLSIIADIKQQSTLIASGISENADGERGQYTWNLRTSPTVFVPSGTYYLYGIIDDEKWTRSTGSLHISYPPSLKLISPIAQGSRATDTFTISWIAQDVDEDAQIDLYYSRQDQSSDVAGFIAGLTSPSDDAGQINVSALSENETALYIWDIKGYETEHSVQLAGSYHIYARITEPSSNTFVDVISPGQLTIRRIDIRLHPGAIVIGANESFNVDVEINTHGIDISGASIYLSFNPAVLKVRDLDDNTDGIQPFRQASVSDELFNRAKTTTSALENDTHGDTEATTGRFRLDYSVVDTRSPYRSNEFVRVASLTFTALSTDTTRAVNTTIGFDYEESTGRNTTVITANVFDDLSVIAPVAPFPALSVQIAPLAAISGHIRLQGRSSYAGVATFELRKPVSDHNEPTYAPVSTTIGDGGDEDAAKEGVQVTIRSDGSFQLLGVPSGRWELVAKMPSYLRGQYYDPAANSRILQVVAGDTLQSVDILNRHQSPELLGGDANDDNRINIVDLTLLSTAFGSGSGDADYLQGADLDADGQIGVADFAILAQNFGEIGIPPTETTVPPPAAPLAADRIQIVFKQIPSMVQFGQLFEISVSLLDGEPARGYAFQLFYDPTMVQLLSAPSHEISDDALSIRVQKRVDGYGVVHVASVLKGTANPTSSWEVLDSLRFRALKAGETRFRIQSPILVDKEHHLVALEDMERSLLLLRKPAATFVYPNYPNPFNPDTWIPYELDTNAQVTVRIFDVDGKLIRTLELGNRKPGVYLDRAQAIHWDGRNTNGERVSSGVYFYQFQADSRVFMRKMLLVK